MHDGVTLNFFPSSIAPVHVRIGVTTAQDLTCDLGPPIRVHYREDNRMTIHSKSKEEDPEIDTGCLSPGSKLRLSHHADAEFRLLQLFSTWDRLSDIGNHACCHEDNTALQYGVF